MVSNILDIVKATFRRWWNDDAFQLSAAIAFYTIFSLAPILLISVAIAGMVFSEAQVKYQIVVEIERLTGAQGGEAIRQVLDNLGQMQGGPKALLFGIVTLIVGSTAVFVNLQGALNRIWQVQPRSSMWITLLRVRMRSFGIVLAVGFLLLVSMMITALLNGMQRFMADRMGEISWVWQIVNMLVSYGVVTLLFAMIYKYLPDVRIGWKSVIVGALITSALFNIGKYLIGFYLGQVAFGSAFGAAGSFAVLLIWIYYSSLICFFGAELTEVYARRYGVPILPEKHATRTGNCD